MPGDTYYFFDDILSGGGWSEWRLPPAPAYFPDLLIYFAVHQITDLVPVQIVVTTSAQVLIILVLSQGLARSLNDRVGLFAYAAISASVLFSVIVSSQYTSSSKIGIFFWREQYSCLCFNQ